ncbi:hypothetical protein F5B21DRAFT_515961 [Xylaria acuta]|nr:hypothetical protein F5B21DRAFT_515961 [Xylaria acuta]
MGSYRHDYYKPDCDFPRFPNRRWGRSIWFFIVLFSVLFFLTTVGGIIAIVVLITNFINTDNIEFEPHNPSLQLLKNSRFEECSSPSRGNDGNHFDWCTAASFFNGYEFVPSSVGPAVISLTNLGNGPTSTCNYLGEVGLINSVILLYTLGSSIVWWWVDYVQLTKDSVPNTTLLASNIHYHPYSCILDRSPGLKLMLSWLLSLIVVAQWDATVHLLTVGWRDTLQHGGIYQGYDYSEAVIVGASGTAQCLAERLCSGAALLVSVASFAIFSIVALQPFSEQFKRSDIGPIAGPAIAGIFAAFFSGVATRVGAYLLTHRNCEAPLVANAYCNAVHVGLSTWRYYLDVDLDERVLRIAKSFLSA